MRRALISISVFLAGVIVGVLLGRLSSGVPRPWGHSRIQPVASSICYSCTWEGYDAKVRTDLINYYRQYVSADPLVSADAHFVLWRATGTPNCDILKEYRRVAANDPAPFRRYVAAIVVAFSGPECGDDTRAYLKEARKAAQQAGLTSEAAALATLIEGQPRFGDVEVRKRLVAPAGAQTLVLGESAIRLAAGTAVGVQVDRVVRDWISAQLKWPVSDAAIGAPAINYHEGAVVKKLLEASPLKVYPLAGALVARRNGQWYAADESGTFRFQVLDDKLQYPTSHALADAGWVEDTHGISSLVPQALERKVQLVIGCGDTEGKAKAAFHLASKGVNVFMPGDRFANELLGYEAAGTILGGAPIRKVGPTVVIGAQPVRFSLREAIVVEDTKQPSPIQYYDAPARYFRELGQIARLQTTFVEVDNAGQIGRVLGKASELSATAVAVRVVTEDENRQLRAWLGGSPQRRAILFHSALYPYAQGLFADFPQQVTFGDLHPRFE